jgi:hypothetical protein
MDSALFMPNEPNSGARDRSQGGAGEDGSGSQTRWAHAGMGGPTHLIKRQTRKATGACPRRAQGGTETGTRLVLTAIRCSGARAN